MDSSSQDKNLPATPQRLKKARDDGQVARSKDLSTTISLIATLFILKFSAGLFLEGLSDSFRLSYIQFGHSEIGLDDLDTLLGYNLLVFISVLIPLLITPILVIVFALVPGGWVLGSAWLHWGATTTPQISMPVRHFLRTVQYSARMHI